jgi:hypothetical protein
MQREFDPAAKTAVFLGSLALLAAAALWLPGWTSLAPGWAVRYGAALVGFSIWMWWFVSVGVDRVRSLDD